MNETKDSFDEAIEETFTETQENKHLEWRTETGDHIVIRYRQPAGSFCGSPAFFEVSINDGPPRRAYHCIPVKIPPDTVARLLTINVTQEQYTALQKMQNSSKQ
jgi:hypothetical protein